MRGRRPAARHAAKPRTCPLRRVDSIVGPFASREVGGSGGGNPGDGSPVDDRVVGLGGSPRDDAPGSVGIIGV
ncbi:hypothetical protein AQ610_25670 [Burkholderia humptydooensis]|uniref:Uncharacterized protein n=1 Tax=Burkholderia humptydooensis MSMB43 TaxID=441157 RepID=A0ABN0G3F9_9BURK|nr:hypothetical protein AQ610_25670 [Burkholderia humptydooensis]EIP86797.1 hypothetical protein A33K_16400 [Burkholderia humptydooensis MSMB43]